MQTNKNNNKETKHKRLGGKERERIVKLRKFCSRERERDRERQRVRERERQRQRIVKLRQFCCASSCQIHVSGGTD